MKSLQWWKNFVFHQKKIFDPLLINRIVEFRTDLNELSNEEIRVLENSGYILAAFKIQKYVLPTLKDKHIVDTELFAAKFKFPISEIKSTDDIDVEISQLSHALRHSYSIVKANLGPKRSSRHRKPKSRYECHFQLNPQVDNPDLAHVYEADAVNRNQGDIDDGETQNESQHEILQHETQNEFQHEILHETQYNTQHNTHCETIHETQYETQHESHYETQHETQSNPQQEYQAEFQYLQHNDQHDLQYKSQPTLESKYEFQIQNMLNKLHDGQQNGQQNGTINITKQEHII